MKLFKLLTGFLLLVLVTGACDNFLDVNEDPTAPSEVPVDLQLSSVLGNFSYEVVGNEPARVTSQWIKQTAFNGVPTTEDNYDYKSSGPNNLWYSSYIDVMKNAKELNQQAKAGGHYAYAGISKVVIAWNLSILTDLFNDIPYSAAFNPLNSTPEYDSQQDIYNTAFAYLDSAITDFDKQSVTTPTTDDLLYSGDMGKWKKLAYTLKARLHLHLTNAPNNSATQRADSVLANLQNGFTTNSDDADFQYYNENEEQNPWYQFAIDGKWDTRNQLSDHYVEMLKTLDDPRLPVQARPIGAVDQNGLVANFSPSDTVYLGHVNGEEGIGADTVSSIGAFYSASNAPLTWLSNAEAKFMAAEAHQILGEMSDANSAYEEGIRANMQKLGVEQADIDNYVSNRQALSAAANPLEDIIKQKYIANFLNFEAYNDWRRTGYPEIDPVTNRPQTPTGMIPVRFPYPESEYNNNAGNVGNTGVPIGIPAMEMKVWWDND